MFQINFARFNQGIDVGLFHLLELQFSTKPHR